MVTKKEISEFKQTLTSALQDAGYTAYGRVSSSEDVYNLYAHLPEQEMVSLYVEDKNLDEINRVYRVIKFISDSSGKKFSLMGLCKEHGINYRVFNHVVENMPYLDKTGERRTTQHHWIHEEQPSFKTAKDIVEHMQKLKYTKLNKTLKRKISKAVANGISKDDFFKTNNIRKEATYSVDTYYNYKKVQQQKKDDDINGSIQERVPEPESSSVISETELQPPVEVNEESGLDEEEIINSEVLDEAGLQLENYILRQEIKYLKKINKAKDKLIKALRKKG